MRTPTRSLCFLAALALVACSDDGGPSSEDTSVDTGSDADVVEDTLDVTDAPDGSGDTSDDTSDGSGDTDTGNPPETLTFDINWPIFEAPADSLSETDLTSCAIYEEERCGEGGTIERCDIYDVDTSAFDDAPDDMLRRAYLYDRWYDLYASPDGQTAERIFTEEIEPGTPEATWADPELFAGWGGAGDSAIWTGTALNAYILRYLTTGTEADYQRMEEKTQVMVNFFEVTGVPGYLARHHYLMVEAGTPGDPEHIHRHAPDTSGDHRDIENAQELGFLPDAYFEEGAGTPRWSGDPSIDQYGGPMTAFPMVYSLLRDEDLKAQIVEHMTCYLHSLRRIEIINLQENEDALGAFTEMFGGGDALNLDPDDIDFTELEEIVMYVHPQINTANEDEYPRECGDFVQMEPWRVIDAASGSFIVDVLTLVQDIDRDGNGRNHINHFYIPSIRGGDAMHMMHLSLMAYAFTGDDRYTDFLRDELLGNIRTAEVAMTMSALLMPKFCRRFYGTNITATPLWAFNNLLADSELDTWMQEVSLVEMWEKETADIGNVNTNLMFAGSVSADIAGDARQEAIDYALEELERFGGNGGVLEDPRRNYQRLFDDVVDAMPEGIEPQCPTEAERETCERPIEIFGATIEGETISYECTDASHECVMEDDLCTTAVASAPLPGPIRRWGDYGWQRSPFTIGDAGGNGRVQSPGTDYAEQYWMARFYEFLEGDAEVLAWRDTEVSCE